MGAVFAGAARAPITAVLILFELTGDYQIILPMMLAIALAAGVSSVISVDTIYTLKLRRRGIDIRRGRGANLMELLTVRDAMGPVPAPLESDAPVGVVIDRFARERVEALPVVSAGRYAGVVPFDQLEDALRSNAFDLTAADLIQDVPPVRPGDTLEHALQQLVLTGTSAVAVVGADDDHVLGWLTHRDILSSYVARLGGAATARSRRTPARARGRASLAWLGDFQVVDLEVPPSLGADGRPLADLSWPRLAMPIGIRRGQDRFVPNEGFVLHGGDRITMLISRADSDRLDDLLGGLDARRQPNPEAAATRGLGTPGGEDPPSAPS
jgi:CIC family chloride channel protein